MGKRISRVGLFVPDLAKAVEYYQKLGFEERNRINSPAMDISLVVLDGKVLELLEKKGDVPFHKDGVLNHITFDVDDIDAAVKEFTAAGTTFFVEPTNLGGDQYFAFGFGVSGEVIELFKGKGDL